MNTAGAAQRENGYDETAGSEESQYEDDEDEEDGEVVVPPAQVDKRREEGEVVPKKLERGRSPKMELSPMKKQANQEQLQNRAKQEPTIIE